MTTDCQRCDGTRFVRVPDAYVDRIEPLPLDPVDAEALRRIEVSRAALANSVYPCCDCNPEQYAEFVAGTWPWTKRGKRKDSAIPEPQAVTPTEEVAAVARMAGLPPPEEHVLPFRKDVDG